MKQINVMALFCESVREEQAGLTTIIGVLPDNLNLEVQSDDQTPSKLHLTRFSIYLRVNFSVDCELGTGKVRLILGDNAVHELSDIPAAILNEAKTNALQKGNAIAGVLMRTALPADVLQTGKIRAEVEIDGETYIAGILNLNVIRKDLNPSSAP
jgi:hypothetical protein